MKIYGVTEEKLKTVNINTYDEAKEVKWCWGRIKAARAKRRWFFKRYANPCYRWLLGNVRNPRDPDEYIIQIILNDALTTRSSLFLRRPEFTFDSLQPEDHDEDKTDPEYVSLEDRIEFAEGMMKRIVYDSDGITTMKKMFRLGISEALWSMGILSALYIPEWLDNLKKNKDKPGQMMSHRGIGLSDPQTGDPIMEPDKELVDEHFVLKHTSSRDYLIDCFAKAERIGATWDGEEGDTPYEKLKSSGRYNMDDVKPASDGEYGQRKKNDKEDEQSERYRFEDGTKESFVGMEKDDPRGQMVHWAFYHDWEEKRFKLLSEDNEKSFLENIDQPPGVEGSIYNILSFIEMDPQEFYPVPPIYPLVDPAREYNHVAKHLQILRKRAARKFWMQTGFYNEVVQAQLQSDVDGEYLQVDDMAQAESGFKLVRELEHPLPPADSQGKAEAFADFRRAGARPGEAYGEASAPLLGQTNEIAGQSNTRDEEKRDIVGDWIIMNGRKLWQLVQERITLATWIRIFPKDPNAVAYWHHLRDRKEIRGEFILKMDVGSVLPDNKMVRAAQLDKMIPQLYTIQEFASLLAGKPSLQLLEEWFKAHDLPISALPKLTSMFGDLGGGTTQPPPTGGGTPSPTTPEQVLQSVTQGLTPQIPGGVQGAAI